MWRAAGPLLAGLVLALTGCQQTATTTPQPDATPYTGETTLAGWPTYHHESGRTGVVAAGPSRQRMWVRRKSTARSQASLALSGS